MTDFREALDKQREIVHERRRTAYEAMESELANHDPSAFWQARDDFEISDVEAHHLEQRLGEQSPKSTPRAATQVPTDRTYVKITFIVERDQHGNLKEAIPVEVMNRLPTDARKRQGIIDSWEGQCEYFRGRLDRDLELDRFHRAGLPNTPARATYHSPHQDDPAESAMHTRNDFELALDRNWESMSPQDRRWVFDYVYGPPTDLHRVDLNENFAVIPEYGPRNRRTVQNFPKGSWVELVRRGTAPKDSNLDIRHAERRFQGGGEQVTLIDYRRQSIARTKVTQPISELRSFDELDGNMTRDMRHPRDRGQEWPKNLEDQLKRARSRERAASEQLRQPAQSEREFFKHAMAVAAHDQALSDQRKIRAQLQVRQQQSNQQSTRAPTYRRR